MAAGALNVFVPQLEKVVARSSQPFLPASASSLQALEHMNADFGAGGAKSIAYVVAVDGAGLSAADKAWYAGVAQRLHADAGQHVVSVQDGADTPALASAFTSADHKAQYLVVGMKNPVGSPKMDSDIGWVRSTIAQGRPAGVKSYVTGDPAVIADANASSRHSVATASFLAGLIIVAIVLLLFRSIVTAAVPLVVIGVALGTARGVVAAAGLHGLPVATYTALFVMALVMGAGTDYSVFLIARFHEARADGHDLGPAVVEAMGRIGPAIVASGATVIAGTACLSIAKLQLISTTGPAMAIAVIVTLLASLTFTPALLVVLGDRVAPRKARQHDRTWDAIANAVIRRPGVLLVCSIVVLAALAAFSPGVHQTFDNRLLLPQSSQSDAGYRAFDGHFPAGELRPDYLLVESPHDLRTSEGFALVDRAAGAVAALPHVRQVVTVTRPTGSPLTQAELGAQLGTVSQGLTKAAQGVAASGQGVQQLSDGVSAAQSGIAQLAGGASQAQDAAGRLADGLGAARDGLQPAVTGAGRLADGAGQLRSGAAQLAAGLTTMHQQVATAVDGIAAAANALDGDALCSLDPVCKQVRAGLHQLATGERDQLLPGIAQAAAAAQQIARGDGQLQVALTKLQHGLGQARSGLAQLAAGQRTFAQKLGGLQSGATQIANGLGAVPGGVDKLLAGAQKLADGLDRSAGYLRHTTAVSAVAPFWLPQSTVTGPRLADARGYFLSPDGHTVRMVVYSEGAGGSFSPAAAKTAVEGALRGTALGGSAVYTTGELTAQQDLQHYTSTDLHLVAIAVLIAVGLVLVLLLRSLLAPLLLLASVVLSYGATMGLTVLVQHNLLHKPIDFTLPVLVLVLLVSVGADYNILLITRIREEGIAVTHESVAKAVKATGRVITSAGLIFAGTFLAMLGSPMPGISEIGFAVAAGLLIDTFIVRSMLVPAVVALCGQAVWWPSKAWRAERAERKAGPVVGVTVDVPLQPAPRVEPVIV
ncbi:MAG TPA: MMPL family transporter [Mycobacteriales bacterium]|nr:MMPL family transporter [Mycobacteriales bacterium]